METSTNTDQNDPQATLREARRLLRAELQDEAWCTAVEATLNEISAQIELTQISIDSSSDPVFRQQATSLIGELISLRQKLERVYLPIKEKSPSLFVKLKHALGLEGDNGTEILNTESTVATSQAQQYGAGQQAA